MSVITRNIISPMQCQFSHKSVAKYLGSANRPEVTVCVEKDHGSFELKPSKKYLKHWIIQSRQRFAVCMWSRQNLSRWITEPFVRWIIYKKTKCIQSQQSVQYGHQKIRPDYRHKRKARCLSIEDKSTQKIQFWHWLLRAWHQMQNG